jgi:alpha-L-rhamnosidase
VSDWQEKSGRLPHITPDGGADFYMRTMNGSVGWSDVGVLMPYRFAEIFGDEAILAELYDGMAKYARFMERRCGKRMPFVSERVEVDPSFRRYLVNAGQSYGEWAEPADVCAFVWTDFIAPHPEVSTAYTAYVLGLMADIAKRLGKAEDEKEFRSYSEGCRAAYQSLVSGGKYSLDTDRQAQLVRPLAFGLLTDEQRSFARKRLIEALEHYGWRLGTGFLSTPLILDVLSEYDLDAAYRLLENEEIPGWLSMPKAGATTIWEAWEGPNSTSGGIGSLNHYSKGAVCEWLMKTMCGIRVKGENHFMLSPRPGGRFTHAEASYHSVYGCVSSRWERLDDKTVYTFTVPSNCTAEMVLPSGRTETLPAGTHIFTEEML